MVCLRLGPGLYVVMNFSPIDDHGPSPDRSHESRLLRGPTSRWNCTNFEWARTTRTKAYALIYRMKNATSCLQIT
jgi:hypothetical protein